MAGTLSTLQSPDNRELSDSKVATLTKQIENLTQITLKQSSEIDTLRKEIASAPPRPRDPYEANAPHQPLPLFAQAIPNEQHNEQMMVPQNPTKFCEDI